MTTPVFSIITPMWKGAALVDATIESVLAQTFTDWEMLIVDDASPLGLIIHEYSHIQNLPCASSIKNAHSRFFVFKSINLEALCVKKA